MAFAITDMPFDARILPESYIMLRDVEKFPFGCAFMQPALLSKEINLKHPSVLIENEYGVSCSSYVSTRLHL